METTEGFCFVCDRDRKLERRAFNHTPHLILAVLTAGLWLPFWLLARLIPRRWRCAVCGSARTVPGHF